MYGKYLVAFSGGSYPYGIDKCGEGQATAYDMNDMACFAIYGVAITINSLMASIQAGFEVCNFNWHMMDTRPAVTTYAQLPGGIGTTNSTMT